MDERLRELQRRAEANAGDAEWAGSYDQALRRAGEDEALAARYRFKFLCRLRFDGLTPTDDPKVRECAECARTVRFVCSQDELSDAVAAGQCVAFHVDALGDAIDWVASDPRTHSAQEQSSPCIVPSPWPFVDVDQATIPREVLEQVDAWFAHTLNVLPITPTLYATARPLTEEHTEFLQRRMGREIRFALADPQALQRAIDRHYPRREVTLTMGRIG